MKTYHTAKTSFTFDNARWVAERRVDVVDFITSELLKQTEKPIKCEVRLAPYLAYLIDCHNTEEFAMCILDVPVKFEINWALSDNNLNLVIS